MKRTTHLVFFYLGGMEISLGSGRQLRGIKFLLFFLPLLLRAQIVPITYDFEARILPSRGGGDSLILEIQYRFLSGFVSNQNDSLGFSNFAISILPLGAVNIPAATLIPGNYFWGDPGPNAAHYLPIQVGGINFLNVTVRRETSTSGVPPLIPNTWTTVAKVYLPINYCPDTLHLLWRKVPDSLGGSGVILNWDGTRNLKDSTLFQDTFIVLPPASAGNLLADTLICQGDSAILVLQGYSGDSIRWQLSPDGINWSTLPIPSTDTLVLDTLTDSTYARAFVYTLCDTSYSNHVFIHVNPPPNAAIINTSLTICFPDSTSNLPASVLSGNPLWFTPDGAGGFHDATDPNTYYVPSIADTGKTINLYLIVTQPGCDTLYATTVSLTVLPPVAGNVDPSYLNLVCVNDTSDTLKGKILFGDNGSWHILSGNGSLFYPIAGDLNQVQYASVSADANSTVTLAYVVESASCNSKDTTIVTLFVSDSARGTILNPRDTICNGSSLTLDGTLNSGIGMWTSTGNGTFSNPFDPNADYTASNDTGAVVLLWVITSGICPPDVNVKQLWVDLPPEGDFPVKPDTICAGSSTLPLGATVTRGTGHWETPNGQGYFSPDSLDPNASYVSDTNDAGQDIILWWIVENGSCTPDTNQQTVYVKSTKVWGTFQLDPAYDSLCVSDTTPPLNATVSYGTGTWSTTGNGNFIPSTSDPNAQYVPASTDAGNTIQLIWTISQPGCSPRVISQDLYVAPLPIATISLSGDTICEGDSTAPLGGLAGNGSGWWETNGNGEFHYNGVKDTLNPNAYYVSQSPDGNSTINVSWIVSNGICPNDTATIPVRVNKPAAGFFNPPTPNPICAGSATDSLDAGITSGLSGYWTCPNCNGYFTDTTSPNSQYVSVAADAGLNLTLEWNVASPGCDTATYTQTLTVSNTILSGSFPGPLSPICVGDTTDTLKATVSGGNGKWLTDGAGYFIPNNTDPNAQYVSDPSDAGDTLTLVWMIYDPGGACDTSYFFRRLVVNDSSQGFLIDPVTLNPVDSLRDTVCYLSIAGPYRGRVVTGTTWGWVEDGVGALSFLNDSTVEYVPATGDVGKERHIYWGVKNGVCPIDTNVVSVFFSPPPIGNFSPAPPPTCAGSPTDTLNGSIISGMGGYWYTPDGLGSFANPTNPRTVYNSSPAEGGTTVTLMWIVTSPRCIPDTNIQTVDIINTNVTGGILNPQPDSLCKGSISDTIKATVSNGIGVWSCLGCNGVILPSVNDTAIVYDSSPMDPDSVLLIFTLQDSFGLCNAQSYTKTLYLFRPVNAQLLTAKLDPICINDTTDTIFVNTSFDTIGYWSCNGCFGAFTDTFSTSTHYIADTQDVTISPVSLYWIAVDTNGVCPSDTATIKVRVDTFSVGLFPTVPIPDICAEDTTIPLQAVAITGQGFWTCPNCNGGFTLPLSGNSKYVSINADGGDTLLITWNVVNGACDTAKYIDSLYVYKKPVGGLTSTVPLELCLDIPSSSLPGTLDPTTGNGHWIDPTGIGYFLPDSSQPNAQYLPDTALFVGGDTTFFIRWEIWNGPCDTQRFNLQVHLYKPPIASFTLPQDTVCAGTYTPPLGATVQSPSTGQWFTPNGSGFFTSTTNPNASYFADYPDSAKNIFIGWIVDNPACPSDTLWDTLYVRNSGFTLAFRDTLICAGDTIQLLASGANFYSWIPNSATLISNPNIPDPLVFPSDTTFYIVTARDTIGCEISDTVKVWVKTKIPLLASNDTTICSGDTIPLFVRGGNPVIWSPDTFLTSNTDSNTFAFPTYSITYTVKGLNSNGCWSTENVTINVNPRPTPIVIANDVCIGFGQLIYTLNDTLCAQKNWFKGSVSQVQSYGPPYDSTHILFYDSTNTIIPPSDSLGTFTYTAVCISPDGCVGMDDATYNVIPAPNADFYAIYPPTGDTATTVPYSNTTVQFINLTSGAIKFLWNFGDPLSGPFNTDTSASPTHTFVGVGPHTIALYVENNLGCSDLEIKTDYIYVLEQDYYFPNAFTPNGDGVNDYFRPLPADGSAKIILFEIYDRWGKKVFETTSNQGWDGNTTDGKPLDPGTYSYKCIIDLDSRGPKVYTGYVTLIR